MEFMVLAKTLDMSEKITSRIQLTNLLVDLFKQTPKDIIDIVVYFLQGKLWPEWKGLPELGIAEKMLIKAIAQATGTPESKVIEKYKEIGDLGRTAEELKSLKKGGGGLTLFIAGGAVQKLTVRRVYDTLARIARAQGEGSRDVKLRLLTGLLRDAEPLEARFIVRFAEGKLRIGIGDATILDALSIVYAGGGSFRPVVERAYNLRADLGEIAKILVEKGVEALKNIKPEVGVPIKPMLAERHNDPVEMLKKVGGTAFVEYKYDGERAQIHKKGDMIWIYSRRLENITHQYPDVVSYARQYINAEEAIVEGEIVAIDPDTGEMRPFQILMTRKRKHDIHIAMKEVPVKVFLFDALYYNGEDLTVKPLPERRKYLEKMIVENEYITIAEYTKANRVEELEKMFLKAIEDGAEGVMVKALHEKSIYQAGNRGWLWIKYKRDYKSEMTDSVDLVVVGAFYGRGRRAGKIGTILAAGYDPEAGVYKTVCKVGTGFTDEMLEKMTSMFKEYMIDHKHPLVVSDIEADVWLTPKLVAEIIGAELTLSPLHTCGKGAIRSDAGISIRFPRFIRWRDDKGPEDATTCKELVELYRLQLKKLEE
jgi:DNA ligase-1